MAYRKSARRMSKKAGRASRKGGLRRSKKATRKGGLRRSKKAGLSRRVKRGGEWGSFTYGHQGPMPSGTQPKESPHFTASEFLPPGAR